MTTPQQQPLSSRLERRALQDQQREAKKLAALGHEAAEILLVRHGETNWNVEHRLQGQFDSQLNEAGIQQAQALAAHFRGQHLDAIYSSDLSRARDTATAVAAAKGMAVQTTPQLRERCLGLLQGLTLHEAAEAQPEAFRCLRGPPNTRLPGGGESVEEVVIRTKAEIERIASLHPGQRVLVVVHGGVIHAAYWAATGGTFHERAANGSVHALKVQPGKPWAVLRWGDSTAVAAAGLTGRDGFGGGADEG